MEKGKRNSYWALTVILLLAIIILGSFVIWSKYHPRPSIEISLPQAQQWQGTVYIGGAVNNPGFYSVGSDDSITALIEVAGGTTSSANLSRMKLYIAPVGEGEPAQKIDINRAEPWLLAALPGIGEGRAKAIVEYRREHGLFHNINEITKVEGIGTTTYQRIKDLITVAE
mgnify:CR=1 FL=1